MIHTCLSVLICREKHVPLCHMCHWIDLTPCQSIAFIYRSTSQIKWSQKFSLCIYFGGTIFSCFFKSTFWQHFRRSFPLFQRVTMLLCSFAMRMERCWLSRIPMHPSADWTSLTWTAGAGGVTWFDYLFNCLLIYSFWNQKSSYEVLKLCSFQCSNKHSQTAGAFNLSPFRLTFPRTFSAATPGFGSRGIEWKCELVGAGG